MGVEEKKCVLGPFRVVLKLIAGVAFLVVGAGLIWLWRGEVWVVVKGFLGIAVMLLGLILLIIAKE